MNVLHGTWIPESHERFTRSGDFYLWVESETAYKENDADNEHPRTLQKSALATFLRDDVGIREISPENLERCIVVRHFRLPTVENVPVKSYELLKYADEEAATDFTFSQWKIWCYQVPTVEIISLLNEIHFLFVYHPSNMLLGADLLFWYHYAQLMREILLKDQYIPALKYAQSHDSQIHRNEQFQIYPAWEIVSERYETELQKYADLMPQICLAGSEEPDEDGRFFSKEPLLRHFSDRASPSYSCLSGRTMEERKVPKVS